MVTATEMVSPALKYAIRDLETLDRAAALCPQRRVAVQAGGCLGVFPRRLARSFDQVISFEPDLDLFREMSFSTDERNIVLLNAALSARPGMVRTVRARRDGDSSRVAHEGVTHVIPGGSIPSIQLDALGLQVCDLLVLDVEGYELFALQGSRETISRCRPIIMIEISGLGKTLGHSDDDVRTHVRCAEYEFVARIRSDEIWRPR